MLFGSARASKVRLLITTLESIIFKHFNASIIFDPFLCGSRRPTNVSFPKLPGQNLYFHLNHPIKWIRLVGVIIALDIYPTRWIALLDDSSGATIEVTCGRPAPSLTTHHTNNTSLAEVLSEPDTLGVTATGHNVDLSGVDVGTVVKVKGGMGPFREVRQVLLERICRSLRGPP